MFLSFLHETWAAGMLTSLVAVDCHGLLIKEKEKALKSKGNHMGETSGLSNITFLSFILLCQLDDLYRLPFHVDPTLNFNLRTMSISFACSKQTYDSILAFKKKKKDNPDRNIWSVLHNVLFSYSHWNCVNLSVL